MSAVREFLRAFVRAMSSREVHLAAYREALSLIGVIAVLLFIVYVAGRLGA